MMVTQDFQPDWVSPPGDTIIDLMDEHGLSDEELSKNIGLSLTRGQQLLEGKIRLNESLATKLENLFSVSSDFWIKREGAYRQQIEYIQKVNTDWLESLPIRDMMEFGWIPKATTRENKLRYCLSFFGINSVNEFFHKINSDAPLVAFRKSLNLETEPLADLVWLTHAEKLSTEQSCAVWDKKSLLVLLPELRKATNEPDMGIFIPYIRRLLASAGVSLVVLPTPRGCRASGATCFFTPERATLIMSFRYLTDDHFWFTLFHEIGHLILHEAIRVRPEDKDGLSTDEEKEADKFAVDILIPEEYRQQLSRYGVRDWRDIIRTARKMRVPKGIVLGYLQHEGRIPFSHLNRFKVRFSKEDIV
ncbi:TPA: ImmA/IrrE family metallo-endopeptidase [Yersinia enterocolitica]|uniref:ImmA/IrrE family metallo-endopeptidase n=1 Tax=Yersinia enterocolitica TaxID=630 RepID=UPI0021E71532|nr:ImmA/IrrE family metallo-endopeptidase [Yersinia enterocolitica]EKN3946278.1 ImmA/IrrE family metallo-endopeptidase [Yersinia enterocolitica]EKN5071911.1 ImmA/IrrE family metallo-endopeptidase [Yersinia enterocolitica]EKN6315926.1 ImmA/IrrE family metallo-endopeptidase [Yersinia enterocolitica]UYJ95878.1 ImmA/IrrE family metallo-endopeptidase [Yersinia enterocolitica]HDL6672177.1 ImmA/IrrE family metallo-endopeptidase [Yersinia enterocolitica]